MMIGEYKHILDNKNRLSIPSKFRENLGETFYITKGLDECLFVFSESEWRKFEEKLSNLPLSNKSARAFARTFFAGASDCTIDKQGRVLIPQNLIEYAGISKDVYINGAGSRLEIWSSDNWERYQNEVDDDFDSLAENLENLGIKF